MGSADGRGLRTTGTADDCNFDVCNFDGCNVDDQEISDDHEGSSAGESGGD